MNGRPSSPCRWLYLSKFFFSSSRSNLQNVYINSIITTIIVTIYMNWYFPNKTPTPTYIHFLANGHFHHNPQQHSRVCIYQYPSDILSHIEVVDSSFALFFNFMTCSKNLPHLFVTDCCCCCCFFFCGGLCGSTVVEGWFMRAKYGISNFWAFPYIS